jgi:hypothetical protein
VLCVEPIYPSREFGTVYKYACLDQLARIQEPLNCSVPYVLAAADVAGICGAGGWSCHDGPRSPVAGKRSLAALRKGGGLRVFGANPPYTARPRITLTSSSTTAVARRPNHPQPPLPRPQRLVDRRSRGADGGVLGGGVAALDGALVEVDRPLPAGGGAAGGHDAGFAAVLHLPRAGRGRRIHRSSWWHRLTPRWRPALLSRFAWAEMAFGLGPSLLGCLSKRGG